MQSRVDEDPRVPTTESAAAEPAEDTTDDCAEFEVGPVSGDLRCAQDVARSTTDPALWIGAGAMSRT
jgi:hypothetical protein